MLGQNVCFESLIQWTVKCSWIMEKWFASLIYKRKQLKKFNGIFETFKNYFQYEFFSLKIISYFAVKWKFLVTSKNCLYHSARSTLSQMYLRAYLKIMINVIQYTQIHTYTHIHNATATHTYATSHGCFCWWMDFGIAIWHSIYLYLYQYALYALCALELFNCFIHTLTHAPRQWNRI